MRLIFGCLSKPGHALARHTPSRLEEFQWPGRSFFNGALLARGSKPNGDLGRTVARLGKNLWSLDFNRRARPQKHYGSRKGKRENPLTLSCIVDATPNRRHTGRDLFLQNLALLLFRVCFLRKQPPSQSWLIGHTQDVLGLKLVKLLTASPRHHLSSPACRLAGMNSCPHLHALYLFKWLSFWTQTQPPFTSFLNDVDCFLSRIFEILASTFQASPHRDPSREALCQYELDLGLFRGWPQRKKTPSWFSLIGFNQAKLRRGFLWNLLAPPWTAKTPHRHRAERDLRLQDLALRLFRVRSLQTNSPSKSCLIGYTQDVFILESLNCLSASTRHHLSSPLRGYDFIPASPCPVCCKEVNRSELERIHHQHPFRIASLEERLFQNFWNACLKLRGITKLPQRRKELIPSWPHQGSCLSLVPTTTPPHHPPWLFALRQRFVQNACGTFLHLPSSPRRHPSS